MIFSHAYRVTAYKINRKIGMLLVLTSERCLLVVRNEWSKRQQRYKAKPNLGKNCVIDFCTIENQTF